MTPFDDLESKKLFLEFSTFPQGNELFFFITMTTAEVVVEEHVTKLRGNTEWRGKTHME